MRELYHLAELIVSCWKLGNGNQRIPTSHGVLDRALKALVEQGKLPEWAIDSLTFADTRVGLRCLELPAILACARESRISFEPSPTCLTTAIKVDETTCRRMLRDMQLTEDAAKAIGRALKEETDAIIARGGDAGGPATETAGAGSAGSSGRGREGRGLEASCAAGLS